MLRFPSCQVWIFPPSLPGSSSPSASHLLSALRSTLCSYPQYAGQILWNDFNLSNQKGHTRRFGRVRIDLYRGGDEVIQKEGDSHARVNEKGDDGPGGNMESTGENAGMEDEVNQKSKKSGNPGLAYEIASLPYPLSTILPSAFSANIASPTLTSPLPANPSASFSPPLFNI